MGWRVVGASVAGSSHTATGVRCQDFHATDVLARGEQDVLLVGMADGAGSAAASYHGAATAVNTALRTLRAALQRNSAPLAKEHLVEAVADARASVFQAADEFGHLPAEYACTLLLIAASQETTLAAHVGDGGIVVEDDALRVLSFPEQGDYANATRFLIDDDALDALRLVEDGPVRRIAAFTDGLQSLALDYHTRSAFEPFFAPLFAHVQSGAGDVTALDGDLERWLDSQAVNDRTDDDKSLVLAVRQSP